MATTQTTKNTTTSTGSSWAAKVRRHRKLALVLAVVVAPVGLLLAIYWLYKYAKGRDPRYLAAALIIAVLSLAALAGWRQAYHYWYRNHYYYRSYSVFEEYKVPGAQDNGVHDGISFQKPKEFIRVPDNNPATKDTTATLVNSQSSTDNHTLAAISLSVSTTTNNGAGSLGATLSNIGSSTYLSFKDGLSKYLQSALGTKNNIDLKDPLPLRTPNIGKDAWQFDFNEANTDKAYKIGETVVKGKILLIFGNKTSYYFIISSVPYNWDHNQVTWQRVINSIKIDQQ